MYCTHCGAVCLDTEKFCPECGEPKSKRSNVSDQDKPRGFSPQTQRTPETEALPPKTRSRTSTQKEEETENPIHLSSNTGRVTKKRPSSEQDILDTERLPRTSLTSEEELSQTGRISRKRSTTEEEMSLTGRIPRNRSTSEEEEGLTGKIPRNRSTSEEEEGLTGRIPRKRSSTEEEISQTGRIPRNRNTTEEELSQTGRIPRKRSTTEEEISQTGRIPRKRSTSEVELSQTGTIPRNRSTSDEEISQTGRIPRNRRTSEEVISQTGRIPRNRSTSEEDISQTGRIPRNRGTSEEELSQTGRIPRNRSTSEEDISQTGRIPRNRNTTEEELSQTGRIPRNRNTTEEELSQTGRIPRNRGTSEEELGQTGRIPRNRNTTEEELSQTGRIPRNRGTSEEELGQTGRIPRNKRVTSEHEPISENSEMSKFTPSEVHQRERRRMEIQPEVESTVHISTSVKENYLPFTINHSLIPKLIAGFLGIFLLIFGGIKLFPEKEDETIDSPPELEKVDYIQYEFDFSVPLYQLGYHETDYLEEFYVTDKTKLYFYDHIQLFPFDYKNGIFYEADSFNYVEYANQGKELFPFEINPELINAALTHMDFKTLNIIALLLPSELAEYFYQVTNKFFMTVFSSQKVFFHTQNYSYLYKMYEGLAFVGYQNYPDNELKEIYLALENWSQTALSASQLAEWNTSMLYLSNNTMANFTLDQNFFQIDYDEEYQSYIIDMIWGLASYKGSLSQQIFARQSSEVQPYMYFDFINYIPVWHEISSETYYNEYVPMCDIYNMSLETHENSRFVLADIFQLLTNYTNYHGMIVVSLNYNDSVEHANINYILIDAYHQDQSNIFELRCDGTFTGYYNYGYTYGSILGNYYIYDDTTLELAFSLSLGFGTDWFQLAFRENLFVYQGSNDTGYFEHNIFTF